MPVEEREPEIADSETTMPPIFGRCPVCNKYLRPRDFFTDEPAAPPVGAGRLSRAKCDKCGSIIEYMGNGVWRAVNPSEL